MFDEPDIIKQFLIESSENLALLDQQMVELEQRPTDESLLGSIFRTIHTIKGTCGFLGFGNLEAVTHLAESILSQLRDRERPLTPTLVTLILETVDVVRRELTHIEATNSETGETYDDLRKRLDAARTAAGPEPEAAVTPVASLPAVAEPTPAAVAETETGQPRNPSAADATIRVDVGLLDKLMNLVGELVLARNQILQFSARQENASFTATSQRLNLITTQLQEGVMKTRMQPIGVIWNKLPRVVRDLAASCGKQISLEMDGAKTELDKSIIEAIRDPLTHIVRNSCDHGIESAPERVRRGKPPQGRLTLRAFHEGGQVNIEISDDGGGIDVERVREKAVQLGLLRSDQASRMSERETLNLIFHPGLSTAKAITNVSGRGVGMDVVKTNIEKIGGVVDLTSRPGQGTTVKIKIPLTLAIIPGLVVTSGGERFVIPQVSLLELLRLEGDAVERSIETIHGTPVYRRRGSLLPIAYLNSVLGINSSKATGDAVNIVVLQAEERQFGLVVDGISDTQEIVVKPLGKQLKGLSCYAGATIMGDGKVALILDVLGLGQLSGVLSEHRDSARMDSSSRSEASGEDKQSLLLFRSGNFERLAVPLALVARLEEIPRDRLEHASGKLVTQYRGQILPLLNLAEQLGGYASSEIEDPAQVIVFADGARRIGLVVDRILDIVEDTVSTRRQSSQRGILGSAVIANKVTDMIDLHAVIESSGESWFGQEAVDRPITILVADPSPFGRGLARNYFEMAGHRVIEASRLSEVADRVGSGRIDVVVAPLDALRSQDQGSSIRSAIGPTAVLALSAGGETPSPGAEFDDCQFRYDRDAILRSVRNLASAVRSASGSAVAPEWNEVMR